MTQPFCRLRRFDLIKSSPARRPAAGRFAARVAALAACALVGAAARSDTIPLAALDPNLQVTTVVSGLDQPIGVVFLAANDMLVLEKASGKIKRVINGVVQAAPVLDLAVNSNSERGLLSLALHPDFPTTPQVFIRWTESSAGADSTVISEVPLLGNRVDRFLWNGSTLTFDRNIILLRSRQNGNVPVPGHETAATNANENGFQFRRGQCQSVCPGRPGTVVSVDGGSIDSGLRRAARPGPCPPPRRTDALRLRNSKPVSF
ncbi:MAG TPA: PQQ-dependent sugar dehydrogenase [Chthonomonadaceae bacterium]|nr:PQQ-dependent sugar dehydrogenase [Chthonomonadaceae bacterium]